MRERTSLEFTLGRSPGELTRVVGWLRKRGYDVPRLVVRPSEDGRTLEVTVTVAGEIRVDVRQRLERLVAG